jgi:Mor family transcriptional regulator
MKHDVKKQHKERKHNDIFSDFCGMIKRDVPVSLIYKKLSRKYYMDAGSIYRVILEKKGVLKDNKQPEHVT